MPWLAAVPAPLSSGVVTVAAVRMLAAGGGGGAPGVASVRSSATGLLACSSSRAATVYPPSPTRPHRGG